VRKKFLKSLAFAISIALFMSCATITKKKQEITIESNIPGAIVEVDGVELGYTPFRGKIKIPKKGRGVVKISKPGYYDGELQIRAIRDDKTIISGNLGLGFAGGSPFFLAALNENFIDYPERKKEYEDRVNRDEVISEQAPKNDAPFIFFSGAAAVVAFAGFFTLTDMSSSAAWEYNPSSYYVQLREIGQPNLDYSNELSIRYFATMNHSQIAIDVGSNGEYAEALANLMETKMDSAAARQGINEALEESKGDQVMFGDALMERFRR